MTWETVWFSHNDCYFDSMNFNMTHLTINSFLVSSEVSDRAEWMLKTEKRWLTYYKWNGESKHHENIESTERERWRQNQRKKNQNQNPMKCARTKITVARSWFLSSSWLGSMAKARIFSGHTQLRAHTKIYMFTVRTFWVECALSHPIRRCIDLVDCSNDFEIEIRLLQVFSALLLYKLLKRNFHRPKEEHKIVFRKDVIFFKPNPNWFGFSVKCVQQNREKNKWFAPFKWSLMTSN